MKILFTIFLIIQSVIIPCTSAIISGKSTPDGRPLLWKHRDSGFIENKLMFFKGVKYDFIGIINSEDSIGNEIWMGSNSTGFSIINTASYNLNTSETCDVPDDQEGLLMKKALEECAKLSDFEKLLIKGEGKWGISANFGVIDADGGAAYYETGYYSFKKYDANDPQTAPDGYLLRTNFSFSGLENKGAGYFRFESAKKIFEEYYNKNNNISLNFILESADRNMQHSVSRMDVYNLDLPEDTSEHRFIPFRDFIVRNSSVSSMIIQGVKPGEDPALTTLWTVLGFPLTTLITPVWVAAGENLPNITTAKPGETASINKKSLELKNKCFPILYDNGADYLNLSVIMNKRGTGIIQKLFPNEKEIVTKTEAMLLNWQASAFQKKEAEEFYIWLNGYITHIYKIEFGI